MEYAVDSDALEERWQQMFNEFQDFRSRRIERKAAARDEYDAGQKEIDAEVSKIRDQQTESIEAIQGEADARLRQIKYQTDIEIKRLQDEAQRKITEIQEEVKEDIEVLEVKTDMQTRVLEDKRNLRKRKYEEDDMEINSEFSSRLKALDRQFRPSAIPETPPPSATRELTIDPLQVNDSSTDPPSPTDLGPREERLERRQATLNYLPPLRSSEPEHAPRSTLTSQASAQGAKKRRFEGFAKDGCITCKGRIWRCDGARPTCGKCKADGKICLWPQSTASQRPAHDDTSTNSLRGEAQDSLTPRLRPSHTDSTVRADPADPDPLPAYAYDASRRPSQRLVRLDHSENQVEPAGRDQETGEGVGDSFAKQPPVSRSPHVSSPSVPSPPPRQQPERSGERSRNLTALKTITYDEVFENIQQAGSREKHFIVEWPPGSSKWYILRCDKHDMSFGEYPFSSAMSHLYSESHGHVQHTKDNSIRELGVLVIGCDAKRAKKSNLAFKKALQEGHKPKQGNMPRRRRHRSRAGGISKHVPNRSSSGHGAFRPAGRSRSFEGIMDPIPGEVYQGAQKSPGRSEIHWYLVVCLPLDNWKTIGIDGNLKNSTLANSMPPCYQRIFLGNSDPVTIDWALDFQIRGPRMKERQFPCLVLKPGLEIPPWGQDFSLPPDEGFLSWVGAASLRPRWFKHPWTTLSRSIKGIEDGQEVAREYRERLEAYRASRHEPRLGLNDQNGQNEVNTEREGTPETHDQLTAVADGSGRAQDYMPNNRSRQVNGNNIEASREHSGHAVTEDSIVVISSGHDESESSLSPVPSVYDGDGFDSSHSPRSTSPDGRNESVDPTTLDKDCDIDDYNDSPRSPGATRQPVADTELDSCAQETVNRNSCASPSKSPSAIEGLRAIQAELIPGYEEGDGRGDLSTRATERTEFSLVTRSIYASSA